MTISVFLDVTYFEVFFGKVWKNADKIPSHPKNLPASTPMCVIFKTFQCPMHLAGPGVACGEDWDADGQPDLFISCGNWSACAEDNCIGLPNSGQEDTDGDRQGDACDTDDDNDFVLDHLVSS